MNRNSEAGKSNRWVPFTIDHLLLNHGLQSLKASGLIVLWVFLIAASMISVFYMTPDSWVEDSLDRVAIYSFFIIYPPLIFGTLLFFWLGFEWGFIPVFLATFVIAFASAMPVYWAILLGIAFILGLLVYALAYYCVPVDVGMRDVKSFAFFVLASFVAAIASSLGSFIWSFVHDMNAAETMILWRGWWTGVFLQSILIIAPILYLFTPAVTKLRRKHLVEPDFQEVSMKWIYGAIFSVVIVLSLFIIGANTLGNEIINDLIESLPGVAGERILQANDSFQIITWISLTLILSAGLGGIYTVGSWNRQLKEEVEQKTGALIQSEAKLKESLEVRENLLQGIHDRMRNNLTIILALLELQLKNSASTNKPIDEVLKDSHSRLRSLALIHETLHQTGTVDNLDMKVYAVKLFNRLHQSFKYQDREIETSVTSDEIHLDLDRAVPFAMIMNELLVNAYMHAFRNRKKGIIQVTIREQNNQYVMEVRDDGTGLPEDLDQVEKNRLGLKLVRTLSRQIHGKFEIADRENTTFRFTLPIEKTITSNSESTFNEVSGEDAG